MGVKFDRMLDAFQAPTERIADVIKPAPGQVIETANAAGYVVSHCDQRLVHRGQPAGEGRRRSLLRARSQLAVAERRRRDLHRREAVDAADAEDRRDRSRPDVHGGRLAAGGDAAAAAGARSACGISTADRCRRVTCAGCSSSSSSRTRSCIRPRSTPATSRRSSTCCSSLTAGFPRTTAAAAGGGGFGGQPAATISRRNTATGSAASRSSRRFRS